jgi:hypothetical protein
MPQPARVEIIICQLFTGSLETSESIGECHSCGRPVRRDAGVIAATPVTRTVCTPCAEFYPLPRPGVAPDPRAGEGCVCDRGPVECPCGFTCFVCGGLLQPAVTLIPSL